MVAIFHRTSVRRYQDTVVEPEKIERLLRAAMAAPSAGDQQPWEFYVVTAPEARAALAASSPYAGCAALAPVVIVPCYREKVMFPQNREMDMSAATENMLLEADHLGLGAVWLGVAPELDRMAAVRDVLTLPEDLTPFALVPIGYPVEQKTQENHWDAQRVHYVF